MFRKIKFTNTIEVSQELLALRSEVLFCDLENCGCFPKPFLFRGSNFDCVRVLANLQYCVVISNEFLGLLDFVLALQRTFFSIPLFVRFLAFFEEIHLTFLETNKLHLRKTNLLNQFLDCFTSTDE